MNVAILISGGGTNLQSFIDARDFGTLDADISLVLSNRDDAYGLQRAAEAGIETATVDHRDFQDRESFDAALVAVIQEAPPDLVVLAGFMRILTPVFINAFAGKLLNIHPSLLPLYPGLHTHQRALEAGDSEAGATVHFVTEELDGGPPVLQARVPILKGDTQTSLAARVLEQEHQIYPLAASWFLAGRLQLTPAGALLDGELLPPSGKLHHR